MEEVRLTGVIYSKNYIISDENYLIHPREDFEPKIMYKESLSLKLPYSLPNSNSDQIYFRDSNQGNRESIQLIPENMSIIQSNIIKSPEVEAVESRFYISKNSFDKYSKANKSRRCPKLRNYIFPFTSQIKKLFFSNYDETISENADRYNANNVYENSRIYSSKSTTSNTYNFLKGFKTIISLGRKGKNLEYLSKKPDDQNICDSDNSVNPENNKDLMTSIKLKKRSIDHSYCDMDEILGYGSGGCALLVKRVKDNKIFVAKEFRKRKNNEKERDYIKKIRAEYCIGSVLDHNNIVKTIEIIFNESTSKISEILEYCEFDLFSIVISNKMSYEETCCCFKQILTGVQYLHSIGIAHRDLKLDNCVINKAGIVKIIDFGAATIFSYQDATSYLIESSGVVGSDPYLAPEVYIFDNYDPRPVDIWSLAIVFVCMISKKFPWQSPRLNDKSFKLFCSGRECNSLKKLITKAPQNLPKPPLHPPTYEVTVSVNDHYIEKRALTITNKKIFRALPEEAQLLISKMIELSPAMRINIDDIFKDNWIQKIKMCSMNHRNEVLSYNSIHTHTKVSPAKSHIAKWKLRQ